jgi:hypothetical protein
LFTLLPLVVCWRVRTPGASQTARVVTACDSAFPVTGEGQLLRSRSISGPYSRSLIPAYNLPVYASRRPLPAATQDSVRGCSLGFAAAVIADGRLQRACKAQPHRSRRALLTHRAPPSGSGVEAVTRQRVYSSDWRKEAGGELDEPLPAEACRLAAPLERCEPEPLHVVEEPPQARVVIGYQSNVRQKKDRLAASLRIQSALGQATRLNASCAI